jgi:hypothetical protein
MGGELTCQSLEKGTADSTLKSSTGGLRIGVGAITNPKVKESTDQNS